MKTRIKELVTLNLLVFSGFAFSQQNCVYLASDVYPGSYGALPSVITPYNGALYFSATGDASGVELWKYENGVSTIVADINPGFGGSMPNQLTVLGPYLYFRATSAATGMELFRYDGTSVTVAADIVPGPGSSYVSALTIVGSDLYFTANDGITGMEPWKFDGTTATQVADINPGSAGSNPVEIEGVGGNVFFSATHPDYGLELWKYDGVTTTVLDIFPGTGGSDLGELTACGGKLCFRANDGVTGYELWVHNGTTGTSLNLNVSGHSTPWELTVLGTDLFFRGFNGGTGYELWKYNGTTASMVVDIFPGSSNGHPNNLTAVGSDLYFAANNGVVGNELWRYDGTTASLVADIRPGAPGSMSTSWSEKFAAMGSSVFFIANNGVTGDELWRYDGTTAVLGKDIIAGAGTSGCAGMKGVGNTLYFMADNGVVGGELWAWNVDATLTDSISVLTCSDYTSPAGDLYNTPGTYNFVDVVPSVNCPGCDSLITVNLTITLQPSSSQTIISCNDYTSPSGLYFSTNGNYVFTDIIPSIACPGMDSIIDIDLTIIDEISTAIVVFGGVILAQQPGASYQWLDCDAGYAPVSGATDQDFLPTVDGNYACEISLGGCIDTSNCYFVVAEVSGIGFEEENLPSVSIYPNPVSDLLTVNVEDATFFQVEIIDALGNKVVHVSSDSSMLELDLSPLAPGIYCVRIGTDAGWIVHKLTKQ